MRKADNLPPYCAVVTKSGNLNFLESFGPVQACNVTALPSKETRLEVSVDKIKCMVMSGDRNAGQNLNIS